MAEADGDAARELPPELVRIIEALAQAQARRDYAKLRAEPQAADGRSARRVCVTGQHILETLTVGAHIGDGKSSPASELSPYGVRAWYRQE